MSALPAIIPISDLRQDAAGMATSRQVVYEALCSDLELLAQPAMSAGTTS